MFARISWGTIQSGQWDAFEAAFRRAVSKAGVQPGLKGRMLLRDVDDENAGFTLSFWESEQAMRDYEESEVMARDVMPELEPFFTGRFDTTFVEVRYNEIDA